MVGTGEGFGQQQVHDGGMPALQQAPTVEPEARVDSTLSSNVLYLSRNLNKLFKDSSSHFFLVVGTGEGFGQQQVHDGGMPALQQAPTVEPEARVDSMLNSNVLYLSRNLNKLFKDSSSQFFLVVGTGEGFGQQQVHDGGMPALQQASTVEPEARVDSMLNSNVLYLSRNLNKLFKDSSSQFFLVVGTGEGFGQQQVHDGGMPALQQASTVETEARVDSMLNTTSFIFQEI